MIVSITNHKGGVGKTTLAVNLAVYFLRYYDKILLLDFDAQAHATLWMFKIAKKENYQPTIYINNIIKFAVSYDDVDQIMLENYTKSAIINIISEKNKKLDLVPSCLQLNISKMEFASKPSIVFQIIDVIKVIAKNYDLTIIDTPPNLDLFTYSAIAASNGIILPIQLNYMAIQGAKDIIEYTLPSIRRYYNKNIEIIGICVNLSSKNTNIGKIGLRTARSVFKDLLIEPIISRSVRIEEMSLVGKTVVNSKNTDAIVAFEQVAENIYRKIKQLEIESKQ